MTMSKPTTLKADKMTRYVRNAAILMAEAMAAAHALDPNASDDEIERARIAGFARALARINANQSVSSDVNEIKDTDNV